MLKRMTMSSVGGLVISIGLGLGMMTMIAVDFKPEDKVAVLGYEINPIVEEPAATLIVRKPKILEDVEAPPPPPRVGIPDKTLPDTPMTDVKDGIPDFKLRRLDSLIVDIAMTDKNEQPIVRIPPIMPSSTQKSGHCIVTFDVSVSGETHNISVQSCTQRLFERPSVKSVARWKYYPKVQNRQPVARRGLVTKIRFNLADEKGMIIPD